MIQDSTATDLRRMVRPAVAWAVILGALYALSAESYLLFHSVTEIFTIVIEFAVFITAWNGRRFLTNHYVLFIGCAYAGVAIIDAIHVLAYRGMGVFPGGGTDLATQLWIAGRYLGATSFALAPLYLNRRGSADLFLAMSLVVSAILMLAIFTGVFPACFVEGRGLTTFKIASEYVISLLFATGAVLLIRERAAVDRPVLQLLAGSLAVRIAAELAFTAYANAYSKANMIGHLLRTFASYLLYKAIVETAIVRPYDLVFRDLKRHEGELQSAVAELEAFSYSVSHDLRAPLSAISGFSELLQRDCGDQLGEDPRHYIERIRAATKRMNELIDDLLRLSRVSRQPITASSIDVSALAHNVLNDLHERNPERKVETIVAPDIRCVADEALTKVVLENLIGNAWKFTSKKADARIEIGSDRDCEFYVRDNGAGFDPQHASNLFAPFQRLHAASEFPGTGIGLATVQRIVSRHGGRISADAAVDAGATFRVSLARNRQ